MDMVVEVFSALCELEKFTINGIEACTDDFITKEDESPDTAEDYCCGNMVARPIPVTEEVLGKYKMTADEYKTIAEDVAEKLSFGCCGWCS